MWHFTPLSCIARFPRCQNDKSSWNPECVLLTWLTQEIAPTYYDLDSFEQGDIKRSLARAAEKKRRKEAMRTER